MYLLFQAACLRIPYGQILLPVSAGVESSGLLLCRNGEEDLLPFSFPLSASVLHACGSVVSCDYAYAEPSQPPAVKWLHTRGFIVNVKSGLTVNGTFSCCSTLRRMSLGLSLP